MGTEVPHRRKVSRRTVATAVGASLLLVLLVLGLGFANSVSASRVAENAAALHWANATSGTSALTRAALAQAITFEELHSTILHDGEFHNEGPATHEDVEFAMSQLADATDELKHLLEIGTDPVVTESLDRFLARIEQVEEALEAGATDTASRIASTTGEEAYISLKTSLGDLQAGIQAEIEENTNAASRLSAFALFVVILALPAAAVVAYWSIARRQVRELRIRSDSELEAERSINRAKDSFIAGLSHELRTPLTSIYGFAEVLTDGDMSGDREQAEEVAQIIANEAAEMTRMVDDLLAASRLESTGVEIDMARTSLDDVVESAIAPYERAGLAVERSARDVWVETDGARLRHVLINLLSNASRHGGDELGIDISPGEDSVDIEVWDTGPGVGEEQLETLFERFIHAGSAPLLTGSIGLGLAVASRLTALMGGRLTYQRFGGKTYFIVNIPLSDQSEEAEEETSTVAGKIRALSS